VARADDLTIMRKIIRYFYRPALRTFDTADNVVVRTLGYIGEVSILFWQALRYVLSPGDAFPAMANVGMNSMPISLITIAFSGMVLSLYTASQMAKLGLGTYVGGLVGITMARELAPVLAAVVVAARVGSSIAAELGTMKVTEQIDALRSLATNPVQYLVAPRFIACVTMLPVLALFGIVVGTLGGFIVAQTEGIGRQEYFDSVLQYVSVSDVVIGVLKTTVFGAIIAIVSCHQGLTTSGGASGVGRATTRSVVLCIVLIYAADFAIVRLLVGTIQ
jgi:phospholipid/cholesterol/gamma-HCH transport system permease protein